MDSHIVTEGRCIRLLPNARAWGVVGMAAGVGLVLGLVAGKTALRWLTDVLEWRYLRAVFALLRLPISLSTGGVARKGTETGLGRDARGNQLGTRGRPPGRPVRPRQVHQGVYQRGTGNGGLAKPPIPAPPLRSTPQGTIGRYTSAPKPAPNCSIGYLGSAHLRC